MLVLTRYANEAILIGDDIRITVIGHKRKLHCDGCGKVLEKCTTRVRLGIEAPDDVAIHRAEVLLNIQNKED